MSRYINVLRARDDGVPGYSTSEFFEFKLGEMIFLSFNECGCCGKHSIHYENVKTRETVT